MGKAEVKGLALAWDDVQPFYTLNLSLSHPSCSNSWRITRPQNQFWSTTDYVLMHYKVLKHYKLSSEALQTNFWSATNQGALAHYKATNEEDALTLVQNVAYVNMDGLTKVYPCTLLLLQITEAYWQYSCQKVHPSSDCQHTQLNSFSLRIGFAVYTLI